MRLLLVPSLALLVLISGCSNDPVIPDDGPTMDQIYFEHMTTAGALPQGGVKPSFPAPAGPSMAEYTRTSVSEIDNLFPRVPNPTLLMFVVPHTGEAGAPVPGYTTAFKLYREESFALPGEVVPR